MASRHLFGAARFRYLAAGGILTELLLAARLIDLEPVDVRTRHEFWPADHIHREIVTLAVPVYDVIGTIRYENEPDRLKAMLRRGLYAGSTLEYQDREDGPWYPTKLVRVIGATSENEIPILPDRGRFRFGEYECRIHLRRVDGGTLDGLL